METSKKQKLAALAVKRKRTSRPGYKNLHELAGGAYDCDFVASVSKTAGNIESDLLVFLQDPSSEDSFNDVEIDAETVSLGYTPSMKTNVNLSRLLFTHFNKSLKDIYASNVFPLIKAGTVSSNIPPDDMTWAAREFALPQVEILRPRLVVVLGVKSFDAIRQAANLSYTESLISAIKQPFDLLNSKVWCQEHTGRIPSGSGSMEQVESDWKRMADWYHNLP